MRFEQTVTTISWIPSEAVTGPMNKAIFGSGFTHYDDPPPDVIDELEEMGANDKFRFANRLHGCLRVALNGFDLLADLFGCFGGLLGQLFDLVGNDGETFACFTGARGFDGGIEGEEIGLLGDRGDDFDDLSDFDARFAKFADGGVGGLSRLDGFGRDLGGFGGQSAPPEEGGLPPYDPPATDDPPPYTPPPYNPPVIPTGTGGSNSPAAVPEPSSWALMITGFGAAGALLRSKRKAPLAA